MALDGILNAMSVENKPGGIVYEAGARGGSGLTPLGERIMSMLQQGPNAAQSGVNAVLAGGGQIQSAIGNMNKQAESVIAQGNAVNQTAGETKQIYSQLGPLAALLGEYGTDLWRQGSELSDLSKSVFGQGNALLNMDPNAGGLAGEYMKMFAALSPDRYVSQAASDIQASLQNQVNQAERDLTRRGVSSTSGAFGALRRQAAMLAAVASASTKQRARQLGINEQKEWLGKMTDATGALFTTANQTQQNALSAQTAAASAQGKAADVIATQGQGFSSAGALQASAGQLFASAASIYGNTGTLQNSYLSLVNQAYGNLASAYNSSAATAASAFKGGGGGGGGKGGVSIEPNKQKEDSGGMSTYEKNLQNDGYEPKYSNPNAKYYN